MKTNLLGVLLLVSLILAVGATSASAQDGVLPSFGIRPTQANPDRAETFSYFVHTLEPGAVFTDEALVLNEGDTPITLKLYTADGITAQNGGTAFPAQGELSTGGSRGVSAWLSVPVSEIVLGAGEETIVSFTINVPADASPGHHIAGLVVEAPPSTDNVGSNGEGETQFAVAIVQRVGVAVVIDVPGPRLPELEILDIRLEQQREDGAVFSLLLHNKGNIFLKSSGLLDILAISGEELNSLPLELDTILSGDIAIFHVAFPVHLTDGDYLLNVGLIYADGQTSRLDGVELSIRGGQSTIGEEAGESMQPSSLEILTPVEEGGSFTDWLQGNRLLVALVLGLLIVGLVIFEIAMLRKLRRS